MLLLLFATPATVVAAPSNPLRLRAESRVVLAWAQTRAIALTAQSRTLAYLGDAMTDTFLEPFDPRDLQSYTFDLTNVLGTSENIATATVTAPSGLTIGTGSYAVSNTTKAVTFWLEATDPNMLPVDAPIVLTVTTNSSPARRLQRTGIVQVRQR